MLKEIIKDFLEENGIKTTNDGGWVTNGTIVIIEHNDRWVELAGTRLDVHDPKFFDKLLACIKHYPFTNVAAAAVNSNYEIEIDPSFVATTDPVIWI